MNLKDVFNQYKSVFESVGVGIDSVNQDSLQQKAEDELESVRLDNIDYLINVYKNVLNSIKYSEPDFYRMDLNNPSEYENFVKYIQAELFIKPLIEERMFSDEDCYGHSCRLSNAGLYGVIDFVENGYDEEDSEYYITNPDKSYVLEMKITGQDKENQPWERNGDVWDCATGVPNPKSEVLNKKFYIDEADSLASTYKNWYHKTYEDYIEYNGEIDTELYKLERRDKEFMSFLKSDITDLSKFNYKLDDDFLKLFGSPDNDDSLECEEDEKENCGYYLGSLEKSSGCLYLNIDFRNGDRIEKDAYYIDILQDSDDLYSDDLETVNDILKPELMKLLKFPLNDLDESLDVNINDADVNSLTGEADKALRYRIGDLYPNESEPVGVVVAGPNEMGSNQCLIMSLGFVMRNGKIGEGYYRKTNNLDATIEKFSKKNGGGWQLLTPELGEKMGLMEYIYRNPNFNKTVSKFREPVVKTLKSLGFDHESLFGTNMLIMKNGCFSIGGWDISKGNQGNMLRLFKVV